ncbi:MAG: tRNA (adenosine(37)-N6)-dimethylallyltransferase MiaA [Hyphococcus sp.]
MRVIFIAGPTASGKSAAALAVAEALGGDIVNADAMQVYRDLRIVTARPSEADEARAPHHLYGVLDGAEPCSAGRWARKAADTISAIGARGRVAVVAGGTGLYFKALEEGLSPVPEAPPEIRAAARARRDALGAANFRKEVIARDPAMARLPEGDAQRLMRAWEVFETTGAPLSSFQSLPRQPLISDAAMKAVILPHREALYAACDARARAMLEEGAVEEARALLARDLDLALPVMKALGVPEIGAFLKGEISRDEALALLQRNTRRFAKRQTTWLRHQADDWPRYEDAASAAAALVARYNGGDA